MSQKKSLPLYPILGVSYYFLYLYAVNIENSISFVRLLKPWGVSIAIVTLIWALFAILLRSFERSALICGTGAFLFFSYGMVQDVFQNHPWLVHYGLPLTETLLMLYVLLMALRKKTVLTAVTRFLNISTLVLMMFPAAMILQNELTTYKETAPLLTPGKHQDTQEHLKPNVFYIITDEYPRADILKKVYGYDNSDFINFLKTNGFYVAENSHANYARTELSLPSSHDMNYLEDQDEIAEKYPAQNPPLLSNKILYSRLAQTFKQLGYRYVTLDSGESTTRTSKIADEILQSDGADDFDLLLLNATLMKSVAENSVANSWRRMLLFNFKSLGDLALRKEPTFVFAHLICPHPPFVFDRKGSRPPHYRLKLTPDRREYEPPDSEYQKLYLDQLIFTNELLKTAISSILKNSAVPPIIVLQSDHGSWPAMKWELTQEWIEERMPILNAYYVPRNVLSRLYQDITPVNSFRLIFSEMFNLDMPLLEDRLFYSNPYHEKMKFTEITDRFNKKS